MTPNGYILWKGLSLIDNQPIVVIATGFTRAGNRKTGAMIQVWIIRSDIDPVIAIHNGENGSVCGNCKHRPNNEFNPTGWGTCYVNVGQAPLAVYNAYKRGVYSHLDDLSIFFGRRVRFGAYGDPAAVPVHIWQSITAYCDRHTAYTHQWRNCDQRLRDIAMASVDTPAEMERANAMGWRTFRVRTPDEPLTPTERVCPASEERGKIAQCQTCMACHGGGNKRAGIAILAHGSWKAYRFVQIRVAQKSHTGYLHTLAPSAVSVAKRVHTA